MNDLTRLDSAFLFMYHFEAACRIQAGAQGDSAGAGEVADAAASR
jgi:hypothetical protein